MTWLKIDDKFRQHPKVMSVGFQARWLHVAAMGYASEYRTDGFIPQRAVRALSDVDDPQACAGELVAARLWEIADGGYQIHDYLDYNPSKEQIETTQEERAEAGRKGGVASGESKRKASGEAKEKQDAKQVLQQNGSKDVTISRTRTQSPTPSRSPAPAAPPTPPQGAGTPPGGGGQAAIFNPPSEAIDPVPEELQRRWQAYFFPKNGLATSTQWENRIDRLNTFWADFESLNLHTEALDETEKKCRSPNPDARVKYYGECLATISSRYVRVDDG